uniref:Secreted protein n=1 Tax=Panagrellus redivivus TaxID=6233 RepID=A0A7E4ZTA9_PANRE
MASVQCTFAVLILAVLIALFSNTAMAYPAYGEYYNGIQGPYYNPYGAISGNFGGSSWDSSVVNHVFF